MSCTEIQVSGGPEYWGPRTTDFRSISEILGHASVTTTMIHTHVINRSPLGITSPLDEILDR